MAKILPGQRVKYVDGKDLTASELNNDFQLTDMAVNDNQIQITNILNGSVGYEAGNAKKLSGAILSVDGALGGGVATASNLLLPTEKAIATYVKTREDSIIGVIDALKGVSYSNETIKNNYDLIESLMGTGRTTESVKDNYDSLQSLMGLGRTTENVKANYDEIYKMKDGTIIVEKSKRDSNGNIINTTYETIGNVNALKGVGYVDETVRGNKLYTDSVAGAGRTTENVMDNLAIINAIKGGGYVDQTIKGNYDLIEVHKIDYLNPHKVTATQLGVYTQTEMQTVGQAQLTWENITNKPNFSDSNWGSPVATVALLPAGDPDNAVRIVVNDSNNTPAIYVKDSIDGWVKVADLDFTNDHSALVNLGNDDHPQYFNVTRGDARYYTQAYLDAEFAKNTTILFEDKFVIVNVNNGNNTFTYKDTDNVNHTGALVSGEYEFTLLGGQYRVASRRIEAKVNNVVYYSLDDEVIEVGTPNENSNVVKLKTTFNVNDEVYFKYHQGNDVVALSIGDGTVTQVKLAQEVIDMINAKGDPHLHPYEPENSNIQDHITSQPTLHRVINDVGITSTDLLSAQKILSLLTDKEPANANIQSHISNVALHRQINDLGIGLTDLLSASKILSLLSGKSDIHPHPYESANANIQSHISNINKHREINDAGELTSELWSASKIKAELDAILTLFNSNDINLDTLQEIVDFIKANDTSITNHMGDNAKHRVINDSAIDGITLWSTSKISTELGKKSDTNHKHGIEPFSFTFPTNVQWVDDTVAKAVNGAYYYDFVNVSMAIGVNDKITVGVQEDDAGASKVIADAQVYKFERYDVNTIRMLGHTNNDISTFVDANSVTQALHLSVEIERKA